MKPCSVLMLAVALPCIAAEQVPVTVTNRAPAPRALYLTSRTNLVPVMRVIQVASELHVGMKEAEAAEFLEHHGISGASMGTNGEVQAYSLSIGCSHGWTTFYELDEGCSLGLEMKPSEIRADGFWGGNGMLQGAVIQSNCVNIVTITLTNQP